MPLNAAHDTRMILSSRSSSALYLPFNPQKEGERVPIFESLDKAYLILESSLILFHPKVMSTFTPINGSTLFHVVLLEREDNTFYARISTIMSHHTGNGMNLALACTKSSDILPDGEVTLRSMELSSLALHFGKNFESTAWRLLPSHTIVFLRMGVFALAWWRICNLHVPGLP